MKKILTLLSLFGFVLLCVSCVPPQNRWDWIVKNDTGQTLKLKYPEYSIHDNNTPVYRTAIIAPDGFVHINSGTDNEKKTRNFNYFFNLMTGRYGKDLYWQVLSEDDAVLKTWSYADRNLPNQRFFEESEWRKEQAAGHGHNVEMAYFWTFDILPEDISSE